MLVKNADRNIEALAILERILDEKHEGQLLQRQIDAGKGATLLLRGKLSDAKSVGKI